MLACQVTFNPVLKGVAFLWVVLGGVEKGDLQKAVQKAIGSVCRKSVVRFFFGILLVRDVLERKAWYTYVCIHLHYTLYIIHYIAYVILYVYLCDIL